MGRKKMKLRRWTQRQEDMVWAAYTAENRRRGWVKTLARKLNRTPKAVALRMHRLRDAQRAIEATVAEVAAEEVEPVVVLGQEPGIVLSAVNELVGTLLDTNSRLLDTNMSLTEENNQLRERIAAIENALRI